MKIKEIENQYNATYDLDQNLTLWAVEFGDKLLDVAKAAKELTNGTFVMGTYLVLLERAIEELEK